MILGVNNSGERVSAFPLLKGITCGICKSNLVPKCGKIKVWHFAHESKEDCDSFSEPESEWHKAWKDLFSKEEQEVIIENHRADIFTKNGMVIELQNSGLSGDKIIQREYFYGENMIWIINAKTIGKGLDLRNQLVSSCCKSSVNKITRTCKKCEQYCDLLELQNNIRSFRWKQPPKSWWYAKRKIFVDLGDTTLFEIKKLYTNIPCGGWGVVINKKQFLDDIKEKVNYETKIQT